jgi:hypothetical protein
MTSFVRKSLITITAVARVPGQPLSVQPANGLLVLRYKQAGCCDTSVSIVMTNNGAPDYVWSAVWDSSATPGGRVDWVAYFSGGVQAAQEGSFFVEANDANTF